MKKIPKPAFSSTEQHSALMLKIVDIIEKRIELYRKDLELPHDLNKTNILRGCVSEDRELIKLFKHKGDANV